MSATHKTVPREATPEMIEAARIQIGGDITALYRTTTESIDIFYRAMIEAAPASPPISDAMRDIAAERQRQVEVEGWTAAHDDQHSEGEMADAAACYAGDWPPDQMAYDDHGEPLHPVMWPWSADWWKPKDRRRDLIRAGALIVAEIERLDRAALLTATGGK